MLGAMFEFNSSQLSERKSSSACWYLSGCSVASSLRRGDGRGRVFGQIGSLMQRTLFQYLLVKLSVVVGKAVPRDILRSLYHRFKNLSEADVPTKHQSKLFEIQLPRPAPCKPSSAGKTYLSSKYGPRKGLPQGTGSWTPLPLLLLRCSAGEGVSVRSEVSYRLISLLHNDAKIIFAPVHDIFNLLSVL